MYGVVLGDLETTQRNWGREFYPTFMVCIHMMSSETMHQTDQKSVKEKQKNKIS